MREKITINAVHESDLEGFMKKLGLWDDYKKGELRCLCRNKITDDNLVGFVHKNGKPYALCNLTCQYLTPHQ